MKTATHVALLHGVNVGRNRRIAMADLRRVAGSLGFLDPRTLLNSGNLAFELAASPRAAPGPRLQAAIAAELGVSCRVSTLTGAELAAAVACNPLAGVAVDPSRLLVAVLAEAADQAHLEAVAAQDWAPEAMAVAPRVAYLWCAEGVLESRVWKAIGQRVKDRITARNWTTMGKLEALARRV